MSHPSDRSPSREEFPSRSSAATTFGESTSADDASYRPAPTQDPYAGRGSIAAPAAAAAAAAAEKPKKVPGNVLVLKLAELMFEARNQDLLDFSQGKPSMRKLALWPQVEKALNSQNLHKYLISKDFLTACGTWLERLHDGTLPNLEIRTGILKGLLSIDALPDNFEDQIAGEEIGFNIHVLVYHPHELAENRNLAQRLIFKWAAHVQEVRNKKDSSEEEDDSDIHADINQKVLRLNALQARSASRVAAAAAAGRSAPPAPGADEDETLERQVDPSERARFEPAPLHLFVNKPDSKMPYEKYLEIVKKNNRKRPN
ncbi:hypothetical protein H696_02798 [Fonticula alba]|uniref:TFIIS N-terminal domain-containing protein n=1 Tax=Fonticula alba TaxID=691883 RepID=A0A058Z8P1_FONAL|nr:hypothetical protein H696_02798 [Fonticula alba]KCV70456.1 hypothetical protein H696_02798 [Fonticula alba]|eukprot:XP_009494972.1 hypothetical protein H696_02798 [Fonticula alba]